VDVLFVGPLDLTQSLGVPGQFNHPRFLEALSATSLAARRFHKTAGIILNRPEELRSYMELGYRFIACNSDGGLLNGAARALANSLKSAGIS